MALNYEDAKAAYYAKLTETEAQGYGRIEAAMLAMCEFVYQRGIADGMQAAYDAERQPEIFSKT